MAGIIAPEAAETPKRDAPRQVGRGRRRWINRLLSVEALGIAFVLLGISITLAGHLSQHGPGIDWRQLFLDFYANAGAELTSIALTVLIIDRLHARRERLSRRERLIWEMGSKDNRTALYAADALRAEGWVEDGSLYNVDLKYANLEGALLMNADLEDAYFSFAILRGADLRGANLRDSILREADLSGALLINADLTNAKLLRANLQGANLHGATLDGANFNSASLAQARGLTDAALARTARLAGAVLPSGNLYDGRFRLPGDIADAGEQDEGGMAAFYGVSLEAYRRGLRAAQKDSL